MPFPSAPSGEHAAPAAVFRSLFLGRNQHVLLLLLEDVIDHSPQSLVASRLLFQKNVLLISGHAS